MPQTSPMPYFDPISNIGAPSGNGPDQAATPILVAAVQQTGPTGHAATEDFSRMPVTQIDVVARTANPEFPNGLHTYIDITRGDEGRIHHQYIAADPVGGAPFTGEGGQLTYIEGHERAANALIHSAPLHAPPGTTLTQYGNAIVDGAKAYNEHPVRYDGLAEDGYNSNSFVSSLLIAKGGATASRDLEAMIAKGMNTPGPLRTDPKDHSITDSMAANFTERQYRDGKYSVPGLDHASIDRRRFTHDPTVTAEPRPQGLPGHDVFAGASAVSTLIGHDFSHAIQKAMSDRGWAKPPVADPTLAPPDRTHGVRIRVGDHEQVAGPGFRQAGTIESINERANTITQRIDRGNVTYNLNELRLGMGDPPDFASRLAVGKRVNIAITASESVEVAPVAAQEIQRGHDLGHGR